MLTATFTVLLEDPIPVILLLENSSFNSKSSIWTHNPNPITLKNTGRLPPQPPPLIVSGLSIIVTPSLDLADDAWSLGFVSSILDEEFGDSVLMFFVIGDLEL